MEIALKKKILIAGCASFVIAFALLILIAQETYLVEYPIKIKFETKRAYAKACVKSEHGIIEYLCINSNENNHSAKYEINGFVKFCENKYINPTNPAIDEFGDSIELVMISKSDTFIPPNKMTSKALREYQFSFGEIK